MRPEVTQILQAAQRGDDRAAEQLLPIVYDQLRALAARGGLVCSLERRRTGKGLRLQGRTVARLPVKEEEHANDAGPSGGD